MNYLDLLPYDISEFINSLVLELYQKEQREKQSILNREIEIHWQSTLWCAGFNNNLLIDDIYINKKFNNDITFPALVNICKNISSINYIKPSFIKYLCNNSKP
tara:strand:- start:318 stop:626 length:309 start_codon:yes stop_codon:yes gene_type:complete